MEYKLTYRHTLTRIFSVRCTCGWLWTAGTSPAATRKGEAHLAEHASEDADDCTSDENCDHLTHYNGCPNAGSES
jgi:hypothetical protein